MEQALFGLVEQAPSLGILAWLVWRLDVRTHELVGMIGQARVEEAAIHAAMAAHLGIAWVPPNRETSNV